MQITVKGSKSLIEDFKHDLLLASCHIVSSNESECYRVAEPGSKQTLVFDVAGPAPFGCSKLQKYKNLSVVFDTSKGTLHKDAGYTHLRKEVEKRFRQSADTMQTKASPTLATGSEDADFEEEYKLMRMNSFSTGIGTCDFSDDDTDAIGEYEDLESYEMRLRR